MALNMAFKKKEENEYVELEILDTDITTVRIKDSKRRTDKNVKKIKRQR